MIVLALALAVAQPTTPPPPIVAPATGPVDPARRTAAADLLDTMMPPTVRAQMIEAMVMPMLSNTRRGMFQDRGFATALESDPRVKALFEKFMERQTNRTIVQLRAGLPGMIAAMSNAYARRFDVAQLRELKAFFDTPTGRAYMQASSTIMSDPDVGEWQRTMATQSMANVRTDIAEFMKQLRELGPETEKP